MDIRGMNKGFLRYRALFDGIAGRASQRLGVLCNLDGVHEFCPLFGKLSNCLVF